MNFFSICLLHVIAFIVCFLFIDRKWKFYISDYIFISELQSLRSYNVLSRVWPTDDKFVSLKASAFRHTLISLICSALIWFVNSRLLNRLSLVLTLFYAISMFPRYNMRKRDYETAGEASQTLLKPIKSACFSVIVCALTNYIISFLAYGFRP